MITPLDNISYFGFKFDRKSTYKLNSECAFQQQNKCNTVRKQKITPDSNTGWLRQICSFIQPVNLAKSPCGIIKTNKKINKTFKFCV